MESRVSHLESQRAKAKAKHSRMAGAKTSKKVAEKKVSNKKAKESFNLLGLFVWQKGKETANKVAKAGKKLVKGKKRSKK